LEKRKGIIDKRRRGGGRKGKTMGREGKEIE
jgi:hypothetical protein